MWKLALQPLQASLEEAWKPTRHANDNPKRHSLGLAPGKLEKPALPTRGRPTTRPAANHIATEAPYDKGPVCMKAIVTVDIAGVLASFLRRVEHLENGTATSLSLSLSLSLSRLCRPTTRLCGEEMGTTRALCSRATK